MRNHSNQLHLKTELEGSKFHPYDNTDLVSNTKFEVTSQGSKSNGRKNRYNNHKTLLDPKQRLPKHKNLKQNDSNLKYSGIRCVNALDTNSKLINKKGNLSSIPISNVR